MTAKTFQELTKSAEKTMSVLFLGLKITGADALAIKDGEDPDDDFHVTLAYGYFNRNGADESAIDAAIDSSINAIRDLIPDKIHFDAIGRFPASESSEGKDVIYARVAEGQLEEAHEALIKALKKHGIKLQETFPEYKPHMTLAYIDPKQEYELGEIEASGTAVKVMIGHGEESSHENEYTIMKTDDDKRLVFGWASIAMTVDGEQLEDRQKDIIDPEDLEEAVYEYVLKFRDTGEEHISTMRKKGKLVESCVFTAEKQKAMGIPAGIVPVGWWIGFKIEDDDAWARVKNGTYKMFSIEGKANRLPVEKSVETVESVAKTFSEILKFNPYHDAKGRFSTSNGYASFTTHTKDPNKQHWADKAVARMKQQAAQAAPPKPTKNYDKLGFADYDDADYHQLYNGRQYYQQQQLTAKQQQSVDNYLESTPEPGSLYSHSQNMNYMMATGQNLTGKYKKTHDGLMDSMHNIGYNVELTRYDHADMVNALLKASGAGADYERMTASAIKKALVGKTVNENKFLSTSYNGFKNAPQNSKQVFDSRAVKINYKVKADVQGMMPGKGPGGDLGELILAPTNGTANRGGKIVDVRMTGQMVRRKGTQMYNQPRIEIDIEI